MMKVENSQRYYVNEFIGNLYGYQYSVKFIPLDNGGIDIIDSHEISSDSVKLDFLECLQNEMGYSFGKRSNYSLLIEWKAHNILYKKGLFKKRTQDTGLDPKESWIRRLFYRFVCFFCSEK